MSEIRIRTETMFDEQHKNWFGRVSTWTADGEQEIGSQWYGPFESRETAKGFCHKLVQEFLAELRAHSDMKIETYRDMNKGGEIRPITEFGKEDH